MAGAVLLLALAAAAPAIATSSGPVVAPYMEMAGPNRANLGAGIDAGLTSVTAAFVIGTGCTATWDDGTPVAKDQAVTQAIADAQSSGADVIVSFGGAGGKELARTCTDVSRLTDVYQSVITRFDITKIDFDIEGAAIRPKAEKASIARRFAAIRALEAEDPNLVVSATIGVGLSGLPKAQLSFLETAKSTGTRIDLVNIMAMDYGGSVGDMGTAATQAAADTLAQLQSIWPTSTYADLGITPMIGQNDSSGEVTSLQDAATIQAFAAANGVGRLAFWSLNRDEQCTQHARSARNGCSGVAQRPMEFTQVLLGDS